MVLTVCSRARAHTNTQEQTKVIDIFLPQERSPSLVKVERIRVEPLATNRTFLHLSGNTKGVKKKKKVRGEEMGPIMWNADFQA